MFLFQLLGVALAAVVVAVPSVLLIPRKRTSPIFDRVLWVGTWLLAMLGAFAAPSYLADFGWANTYAFAGLPAIPAAIGAVAGALSINVLLWMMDRFGTPTLADDLSEENVEDEDVGESDRSNESRR
jgi:hypothetical protein